MDRRTFIKGLIRCVPAIVVPSLVFDLAPKHTEIPLGYHYKERLYFPESPATKLSLEQIEAIRQYFKNEITSLTELYGHYVIEV